MTAGVHGAAGSALGYAYQGRWALYELIRRAPGRPDASVSLELHDDVAWDVGGAPFELLQLKHHLRAAGGLTDKHADLWATLAVWLDNGQPSDPHGPILTLVTTSTAPLGSAGSLLRDDSVRDVVGAVQLLVVGAQESVAMGTATTRERFLDLTPAERLALVTRIYVLDGAAPISDVDERLRAELWSVLPQGREDLFLALLWRWWDGVVLDQLQGQRGAVSVAEVRAQIEWVRDQFSTDALPTLVELTDVDESIVLDAHQGRLFVTQMAWVNYPLSNIQRAIIDFHRAVTQTTYWLDQDLIGLAELTKFEANLRDEWSRAFADAVDDLGPDPAPDAKIEAGKRLLRELLASTAVSVRSRYNDAFFARGKRHELADEARVGWHPDFYDMVQGVIASAS